MRFEEILVSLAAVTGLVCLYVKLAKPKKESWFVETCRSFFPVFIIVLILRSFLFEVFRIPTGSMKPTLVEGDFIIVNKYTYGVRLPILGSKLVTLGTPKVGDIIVFRHQDGKDLIKRVVGVPGDHIQYKNKQLFINGELMETKFLQSTQDGNIHAEESVEQLPGLAHSIYIYPHRLVDYPYKNIVVPEKSYFVLGDNRDNSEDGRFWGFVRDEDLLGKAFATWMSWDSQHHDIRWERIGKSMYE